MHSSQISTSGIRILKVLKALKGYTLTGLSNGDIAKMINESPVNVTRALQTLIEEGLVIKLDNGLFAHSVQMLQIAQAHAIHITKMQDQITEMNQRITAGAR
ncbi:IclR family transcriptional regulator [Gilliamella sp. App2-1]|jgi:DNA-binding IclR family transcriptional regulator|uniref:helix-turn-helix domain-containing protein n=1 Tax=Gilliamella sp. App2-1 TaxID=3120230 RepID=UPI00082782AF|nr:helix-turn-helix domain-containing protein [Gilliamella apicola]OCG20050.1 IclR family transcriptional regulator [Gilliamella apicola]